MDNGEAMYWLAVVQQANNGDKEAMEVLRQENEMRVRADKRTIAEELKLIANYPNTMERRRQEIYDNLRRWTKKHGGQVFV